MFLSNLLDLFSHVLYLMLHVTGSGSFPRALSAAQEKKALSELAQGSPDARRELIEHNLRLVAYIARRFENTGIHIEDLISIGTIGLIKGISSFDPSKGARLATYAARCIENEILMHFRQQRKLRSQTLLKMTRKATPCSSSTW